MAGKNKADINLRPSALVRARLVCCKSFKIIIWHGLLELSSLMTTDERFACIFALVVSVLV